FGTDALRWWLLRAVPRVGDGDFTTAGLVDVVNRDLANGVGNLARRIASLVHADRAPRVHELGDSGRAGEAATLRAAVGALPQRVDDALERFDFRSALEAALHTVAEANRYLEVTRPWERAGKARFDIGVVLDEVVTATRVVARELAPFVPDFSARALHALGECGDPPPPAAVLFPRLVESE
ncbi:MAG: methionyl-tRNA synthetase, partial [Actinomycetota bacterium]|nr:methionyl-tRNA synthetase [Actinomycetota bacterium]